MKLITSNGLAKNTKRFVLAQMRANTVARDGVPFEIKTFAFSFYDRLKLVAALDGETCWDWAYVDTLWVAENFRGQGLGTQLMQQAETHARQQAQTGVYLWTQSWEAPRFYEKNGFEKFAAFENFPCLHQRYGYRKYL